MVLKLDLLDFALVRHPIALLALPLLYAAKSESANDRNLRKEGFRQIVSPDALSISVGQCRAVAKQTMAAWAFGANCDHNYLRGWLPHTANSPTL
jgi:hypothetical protein